MTIRLYASLCLFLFAAALLGAQPRITIVGGDSIDFGTLYTGKSYKKTVVLRNDGDSSLTIDRVSGSCGCTGALLTTGLVEPGKEASLVITFDPTDFSGKVEKTVSMATNDPAAPKPHIHLTAYVERILDVDKNYVSFNTAVGESQTVQVILQNTSSGRLLIDPPVSPFPQLTLTLSRRTLEPGDSAELDCTFTPDAPGVVRGVLTIPTSDPRVPSLELTVFAYGKRSTAAAGSENRN